MCLISTIGENRFITWPLVLGLFEVFFYSRCYFFLSGKNLICDDLIRQNSGFFYRLLLDFKVRSAKTFGRSCYSSPVISITICEAVWICKVGCEFYAMILHCRWEYLYFLVISALLNQGKVENIISSSSRELQGFGWADSRENGWQFFYWQNLSTVKGKKVQ